MLSLASKQDLSVCKGRGRMQLRNAENVYSTKLKRAGVLLVAGLCSASTFAQTDAVSKDLDVYALGRDAVSLSQGPAAKVWPGLATLEPGFVVIDGDLEVAVCRDAAPGFEPVRNSPIDGCTAFERPRVFPEAMQASLNLFGQEETVMVSPPETLGQDVLHWTLLFVHERFHQLQSTFPDYHARIDALDLSAGDQTGMWMLTRPFPYEDPSIEKQVNKVSKMLVQLVRSTEPSLLRDYIALRQQLLDSLSAGDQRYFEFQLWKEGTARWTEIAVARTLATSEHPDAAAFDRLAKRGIADVVSVLGKTDLGALGRGWFYAAGAAEWLIIDRLDPTWRARYPTGPLAAGPYLEALSVPCSADCGEDS
ncbi:MAG: hypothetical protein AAGA95_13760 [Pseudomonadota bacterium]